VDRTIGASSVDAYEEQVADQLAFEECFPPSAFAGVASALEVPTDPANLDRLRRWLLRDFHAFYFTLPGK